MFKTKYRVVRDSYAGYEVQHRKWWCPFWTQAGGTNTHPSLEEAKKYIKRCKNPEDTVLWAE